MQFAGNRRQLAKIGKVVDENPPGTTLCANGRWSTNPPAPGVCSYNGGWIVNYPNLSRSLQAKAKKKPSALVLEDAPAADPAPVPVAPAPPQQQPEGLTLQTPTNGAFAYEILYRPFDAFTVPKGFIKHEQSGEFYGIVTYPEPLTLAQIKKWELRPAWWPTLPGRSLLVLNDEEVLPGRILSVVKNGVTYSFDFEGAEIEETYNVWEFLERLEAGEFIIPTEKQAPAKPSALVLQDAPAADPAPVPVEAMEEPEEDVTDGPHWRIDPKRKAELHLGYDFYKSLPSETQREIKRFFTWGRGRKAWVSKGRYDSWSVESIIKKLDIPLAGKDERMSFADRMEQQKDNAEYRAERLEKSIERSKKRQEELQAEYNERRKDWSWVTQPNIVDSAAGRAFTNQRNRVLRRYEKGFEEAQRRDELYTRMENALTTAQQWKLKDPDYLQRKIKENQKSLNARTEQLENLQEKLNRPEGSYGTVYRDGERRKATKEDVLDAYEWTLEKYQEAAEQLAFFSEALDRLIEEQGIVIYNKENLKGAEYVKRRGSWYKVIRVNPTTVTHTWHAGLWKSSHSEIQDVVYKGDDFEVTPGRFPYKFNIKRPDKVSGLTPRFRTLRVLNL